MTQEASDHPEQNPDAYIRHIWSPHHRAICADGALMRFHRGQIAIRFYLEETNIQYERATLSGDNVKFSGEYETERVRLEECLIRMPEKAAGSMAMHILARLKKDSPETLRELGVNVVSDEGEEKGNGDND